MARTTLTATAHTTSGGKLVLIDLAVWQDETNSLLEAALAFKFGFATRQVIKVDEDREVMAPRRAFYKKLMVNAKNLDATREFLSELADIVDFKAPEPTMGQKYLSTSEFYKFIYQGSTEVAS